MTPKPFDLAELLRDCETSTRLTEWELDFTDDLRARALLNPRMTLSEKQMVALRKIEAKIHAVG